MIFCRLKIKIPNNVNDITNIELWKKANLFSILIGLISAATPIIKVELRVMLPIILPIASLDSPFNVDFIVTRSSGIVVPNAMNTRLIMYNDTWKQSIEHTNIESIPQKNSLCSLISISGVVGGSITML